MDRALVLAGGGAAGNACKLGHVAGPLDAGVDVVDADPASSLVTALVQGDDGVMAPQAAVEHGQLERPVCWCCGNSFDEQDLTRLGSHPEVGVCAGCTRWLHRRARAGSDQGRRSPGAVGRRVVAVVRGRVMRAGVQDWPVVGRMLRRLDKHLP